MGTTGKAFRAPRGPPSRRRFSGNVCRLEHVVGQSAAKQKIQAIVNALQVNHRRVRRDRAEQVPHVVLTSVHRRLLQI